MPATALRLLADPEPLRAALTPLRRQLLGLLKEPASATELAAQLGLSRQKVNYHVRVLEDAGLLELVEERQRRGCVERVLRANAAAYIVDPGVIGRPEGRVAARDRFAAEHLVAVAGQTLRDVSRMQAAADVQGSRLLTFTIETEVRFVQPSDVHRFTDALAKAVSDTAAEFAHPRRGRRYRIVVGGHPAPETSSKGSAP
ncbi:MAG: helix-turn-helix transcriptional regulator [Geodermatophilaceae bacterium]|nr:helix-turn-helix transcriptional regulator [Geodermatophilaceae bacterium]